MSEVKGNELFRALRADEVEVRFKTNNWNNTSGIYLLYKDARCDMRVLDETFGPFNWQRDHKEIKGNVYCGVSILTPSVDRIPSQWVTKWDAGAETNVEAEKGEASDSFKRACFTWGIGRELYTAPKIEIPYDGEWERDKKTIPGLKVTEMEVVDHKIVKLVISDSKKVRFKWESTEKVYTGDALKKVAEIKNRIDQCEDMLELTKLWNELVDYQGNTTVKAYFSARKQEIAG